MAKQEKKTVEKRAVGKPRAIESPEEFWNLFTQYREWAKAHPFKEQVFAQKLGEAVDIKKERPLTWDGFDTWLCDNGVIHDSEDYRSNRDGRYAEYGGVTTRVRKAMSSDKFEGAAAGIYKENIIARDLGLADKKETDLTTKGKELKGFDLSKLTQEQIDALIALHGTDSSE